MALVFGDIHGCLKSLQTLWQHLKPSSEKIIFLGDYVDRGPDSNGVLDFLIQIKRDYDAIFLMGNHEEMVLECRFGSDYWQSWIQYGGDKTLESYCIETSAENLSDIPAEHWAFLSKLLPYYETESVIFTHACINMTKPLRQQNADELRWWPHLSDQAHVSGKMVIFGHMSQRSGHPQFYGQNLCIDTSAGEWISCIDLDTNLVHQANEHGEYLVRFGLNWENIQKT